MLFFGQCRIIFPLHLFSIITLTTVHRMCAVSDLHKLMQTARKSFATVSGGSLKIAIVGGGYAGLACAYYGCKIANTIKIFGLEDSPGVQKSSSASTISV